MISSLFKRKSIRPPASGFQTLVDEYRPRLARWSKLCHASRVQGGSEKPVAVLLTPWLDTAVPFYSIEIALALHARGRKILFLSDTSQFAFNEVPPASLAAFQALGSELSRFGAICDVTQIPAHISPWSGDIAKLCYENSVWRTKGETEASGFLAQHPELPDELATHGSRVQEALRTHDIDWLLLPGGVFGISGLYLAAAKTLGIDFTTFDSGPGRFFTSHQGIAAHSSDLPQAYAGLAAQCQEPQILESVLAAAAELFREREEMKDHFQFQAAGRSANPSFSYDILICLNYRADTAALFRGRCFPTVHEWVIAVVKWAAQRSLRVAIRPHPVQRRTHVKNTDRLSEVIRKLDPEERTATWIAPDAEINSYDLVENSRVILPFTSTIGIEAAYLGRPVILTAYSYYDSLGFVVPSKTPEEYFTHIDQALAGRLVPTSEQRQAAALCLYLTVRCRSVHSVFTPQPSDFEKWVKVSPEDLWGEPELQDLSEALLTRAPLTWIRHQRRLADSL